MELGGVNIRKGKIRCYNCGKFGSHVARNCKGQKRERNEWEPVPTPGSKGNNSRTLGAMRIRWADQEDPDNQVPRYRQMQIRQIKNHAKMQQKSLVDWLGDHRGWEELSQELKKPWKPVPTTKTDPRRQGQQLGAMRIKHQEGMKQARQLARQAARRAQRETSDPRQEQ